MIEELDEIHIGRGGKKRFRTTNQVYGWDDIVFHDDGRFVVALQKCGKDGEGGYGNSHTPREAAAVRRGVQNPMVDPDIVLGADLAAIAGRDPNEADTAAARVGANRLPSIPGSIEVDDVDADLHHDLVDTIIDLAHVDVAAVWLDGLMLPPCPKGIDRQQQRHGRTARNTD